MCWALEFAQVYHNPNSLEGNGLWILLGVVGAFLVLGTALGLIRSWRADRLTSRGRRPRVEATAAHRPVARPQVVEELGVEVDVAPAGEPGVLIAAVEPDSPADEAGLQAGDLLTHLDGAVVADGSDLRRRIRAAEGGPAAAVQVLRGRRAWNTTVLLSPGRPAGAR